jgi:hypothetical protein
VSRACLQKAVSNTLLACKTQIKLKFHKLNDEPVEHVHLLERENWRFQAHTQANKNLLPFNLMLRPLCTAGCARHVVCVSALDDEMQYICGAHD